MYLWTNYNYEIEFFSDVPMESPNLLAGNNTFTKNNI